MRARLFVLSGIALAAAQLLAQPLSLGRDARPGFGKLADSLVSRQPSPAGQTPARGQTPATQTPAPGGRAGAAPDAQGRAQGPGGQAGQPGGRGPGGGGRGPLEPDDTAGFTQIFDGKTLSGWDGDTKFWRAENGMIVGQSTPENRVSDNTFLIWRGGTVRDFELKIEFRMNGTNSGVQYRSVELPNVGKWVLSGYQADMDFVNQYTGNIHNERGPRFFLAERGNVVRGVDAGGRRQIGTIGDNAALKGYININGWNSYHIIARGPTIIHLVNGRLMAVFIDEDKTNALPEGLLGLQMHVGDPFKVEYRNIWLRKIL